jgi:TonB-dependent Receptor Plug Domain.
MELSAPLPARRGIAAGSSASSLVLRQLCDVPSDHLTQLRELEGLFDKVVGSCLKSLALVGPVLQRGDHHHSKGPPRRTRFHLAANLPSVPPRHHHVEKHERRFDSIEKDHRLIAVIRNSDGIALRLEIVSDDMGVVFVIVDNENCRKLCIGHPSYVDPARAQGQVTSGKKTFGVKRISFRKPLDIRVAPLHRHWYPDDVGRDVTTWTWLVAGAITAQMALGAPNPLGGQTPARLSGTIVDQNRAPLSDAEVTLRSSGTLRKSRSDGSGRFDFAEVAPGPATVTVHRLGFRERTVQFDVGSTAAASPVQIDLMPLPTDIDPVLVEESRGRLQEFVEHRKQSKFGHFFDQNQIRAKSPRFVSELFRDIPGATLSPGSGSGSSLKLRGCQPKIWLDGVLAEGADIDEVIQPSEIAGIEIYSSWAGVPAQYMDRENRACGTVIIWSRQA